MTEYWYFSFMRNMPNILIVSQNETSYITRRKIAAITIFLPLSKPLVFQNVRTDFYLETLASVL